MCVRVCIIRVRMYAYTWFICFLSVLHVLCNTITYLKDYRVLNRIFSMCVRVCMLRHTTHIWFITSMVLYHFVTFPYLTFVQYLAIIVTKCKIERVTFCY